MGIMNFVKEVFKHPRELSTIFPSSPFLANKIADQIDFSEPRTIAELGPGDGALTGELIERMDPDSDLLLLEIVDSFCEELENTFGEHEKFGSTEIINRGAQDLQVIMDERGIDELDYVVSGLPLTTLPDQLSQEIIEEVKRALKPNGKYIQFQYSLDYKDDIEEVFGPVEVHKVWLNIFPANVYVATNNASK